MFGIVDRYIVVQVVKVFAAILGTLMLIVVSMLLLRTLEEVNVGGLGSEMVLRFLGLQLVRDLPSLIPPAFFISVLAALGRMARDSELIALGACGLGPVRMYRAVLYFALPIALLTGLASFYVRPQAVVEIQTLLLQSKGKAQQVAGIKQGRFYQQQQGRATIYVDEIEGKTTLRNVFIQERDGDRMRLVVSEIGMRRVDPASGDRFITLINGKRYDGVPGTPNYAVTSFKRYDLRIEPGNMQPFKSSKRATYPTKELVGSDDPQDRAEFQYRLGSPLAILTLTLLAIPLTATSPRQRASGRMFLALLAYFSFFNLQRVAAHWFESGVTPSWLGSLWYQPLILLLILAILLPNKGWLLRVRVRAWRSRR